MPWIHHPATQDGPVSIRRWLAYRWARWCDGQSRKWEYWALHGHHWQDDDLPF